MRSTRPLPISRLPASNVIMRFTGLNDCGQHSPPLQARYTELRKAERRAAWRANYAEVKAKRDATAEQVKAIYTEVTDKLIEVLEEAKQVDQEVETINRTAPNGEHDRLLTVECWARRSTASGPIVCCRCRPNCDCRVGRPPAWPGHRQCRQSMSCRWSRPPC